MGSGLSSLRGQGRLWSSGTPRIVPVECTPTATPNPPSARKPRVTDRGILASRLVAWLEDLGLDPTSHVTRIFELLQDQTESYFYQSLTDQRHRGSPNLFIASADCSVGKLVAALRLRPDKYVWWYMTSLRLDGSDLLPSKTGWTDKALLDICMKQCVHVKASAYARNLCKVWRECDIVEPNYKESLLKKIDAAIAERSDEPLEIRRLEDFTKALEAEADDETDGEEYTERKLLEELQDLEITGGFKATDSQKRRRSIMIQDPNAGRNFRADSLPHSHSTSGYSLPDVSAPPTSPTGPETGGSGANAVKSPAKYLAHITGDPETVQALMACRDTIKEKQDIEDCNLHILRATYEDLVMFRNIDFNDSNPKVSSVASLVE